MTISSADANEVTGWKFMPQGVEAPEDGYFGNTATAQKTFEALKTTRIERDEWQNTVQAISADVEAVRLDAKEQLDGLNTAIKDERKAAKGKRRGAAIFGVVIGVVAGLVIGNN